MRVPAVVVRNISNETHRALKQRAREKGISTEAEIRSVLDSAVQTGSGLGTTLYEITRKFGGVDLNIARDRSPIRPADFK